MQTDTIAETLRAIKKSHVLAAIKTMDKRGTVPKRRNSTKYSVELKRRLYPPKYLICIAVELATGRKLVPNEHSGGQQTNTRLCQLGFRIVPHPSEFPESR